MTEETLFVIVLAFQTLAMMTIAVKSVVYVLQLCFEPHAAHYPAYNFLPTSKYIPLLAAVLAASLVIAMASVKIALAVALPSVVYLTFAWVSTLLGHTIFSEPVPEHAASQPEPPLTDVAKEILLRELRKRPEDT
jgi:hypothetical protein